MVSSKAFANKVLKATATLRDQVDEMSFAEPVAYVYNPLNYAWEMHAKYVRKWGATPRRVLLLGMNPGPWGMAQTGVPFGEIAMVKEFMGLKGKVGRPDPEHPKRPVLGMESTRSEVSGRRLWGFFDEQLGGAKGFFKEHFAVNYCPLVFMEDSARNRTPRQLPPEERKPLFEACHDRLIALVGYLPARWGRGCGWFPREKWDSLFGPK